MLKEYEIDIEKSLYCYDVRLGCLQIANVWPPRKGKRDYWQVRLLFNQEPGKIDYSKDKHCDSKEDCLEYVHKELKKLVKKLHTYYILNKHKHPLGGGNNMKYIISLKLESVTFFVKDVNAQEKSISIDNDEKAAKQFGSKDEAWSFINLHYLKNSYASVGVRKYTGK